ncbi:MULTISPECIES: hypothetical protein [Mycolicibacter]|uniref:Uncharacterized protein n=1 Tax=Mycolicibacter longobardus TaxID=1108812 RepID=A0A1X1YBQ4_9MYCO|nr:MULTISPECIES: hypothetical protein [Mycolicibacter]ORW08533.1 hypothetical protein AWC16_19235 [Mycolicibacter longobardus]RAV04355.1 hypothetical protein DQP56_00625 [Mycolicibacter senuensis]
MSAYSIAHGPEAAVDLVVANDRGGRESTLSIVAANCAFVDGQWTGIEQAAASYREFLLNSPLRHNPDLDGVDLVAVDYIRLIRSELEERNIQDGRPQFAGL